MAQELVQRFGTIQATASLSTVTAQAFGSGITAAGDVESTITGKGFIARSPNGNRWRLTPSNAGGTVWTAL